MEPTEFLAVQRIIPEKSFDIEVILMLGPLILIESVGSIILPLTNQV